MLEVDGRRLRREQNRQAAVEALASLYREGTYLPSAAEIAERAGLSPRSLFRYFEDVDDLSRAALDHMHAIARPLLRIEAAPSDPLPARVAALVEARLRLWTAVTPGARVMRMRAPASPLLADELRTTRAYLRGQIAALFEAELRDRPGALPAVDVLCSFESVDLLLHDQGLSRRRAGAALVQSVLALLAPEGAP